jgi:hypothetical protein
MNEWAELDRAWVAMASSGRTEIRDGGEWLAELDYAALPSDGKNPLVNLSSDRSKSVPGDDLTGGPECLRKKGREACRFWPIAPPGVCPRSV